MNWPEINDINAWEHIVGPKGMDGHGSINDAMSMRFCFHCAHGTARNYEGYLICDLNPHDYQTYDQRRVSDWLRAVFNSGDFSECPKFEES